MSRDIAGTRDTDALVTIAARHIAQMFPAHVVVLLSDADGRLVARGTPPPEISAQQRDRAQRLYEEARGGAASPTARGGDTLFLPLAGSRGPVGVLGVVSNRQKLRGRQRAIDTPDQRHQLETFANQTALALERAQLAGEAEASRVRAESEELRNSLLSSVSHDLRTPLATITGAASTLLEGGDRVDPATRRELLDSIHEEAERLNRLVQNLLEMTRLSSGNLNLKRQWHPLEEIVGAALRRLGKRLTEGRVITRIPDDLPLVQIDDVLIEQVLINLLDNAVKHTAPDTAITIVATSTDDTVRVEVADHGPGLSPGTEHDVFEKFYRGAGAGGRGAGLGLAIAKAIVQAHGGRIWAQNLPEGGAAFFFSLPNPDAPPALVPEER
jgi:two-component system sensor histidine kinase KdpD